MTLPIPWLPRGVFFITAARVMSHTLHWLIYARQKVICMVDILVATMLRKQRNKGAFTLQLWNLLSVGNESGAFWLTGSYDIILKRHESTVAQQRNTEGLFMVGIMWL